MNNLNKISEFPKVCHHPRDETIQYYWYSLPSVLILITFPVFYKNISNPAYCCCSIKLLILCSYKKSTTLKLVLLTCYLEMFSNQSSLVL